MSDSRKDVLLKALEAEVMGEAVDPGTLFTDDVVGWSPFATVSGLTALSELAAVHDISFSNVALSIDGHTIARVAREEVSPFDRATVRDFVGIIAWRLARDRLTRVSDAPES